jgi:N-acetylmuramoyl-L-alanine amidase
VVIDPGHGGTDSGAVGDNGISEKEVVLKITKEVLRLNRELYNDTLEIYSTRYIDTLISLGHRTMLVKRLKTDAFVSIHCNQAQREMAQGIEVYVGRDSSSDSEHLAILFADGLNQKLGFKNRGVKQANFRVIEDITNYPSILLELGFLSNYEEAEHFGKGSSISGYALLILETLLNFLW